MKRDLDLCRQLLLDLEAKGSDAALGLLRNGLSHDNDQRVRHHLRLLIDAGLVKELDHTASGTTCVRLTNAGHELIELARVEARWQDAKRVVGQRTGGLSLAAVRAVLTKWAIEDAAAPSRRRVRRVVRPHSYRYETLRRDVEPTYVRPRRERNYLVDDREFTVVRTRPDYRERYDWRENVANVSRYRTEIVEPEVGVTLPIYLV